jgi:hypothetical protein
MGFCDIAFCRPVVVIDKAFKYRATRALLALAAMGHPSTADATTIIPTSMGVLCQYYIAHLEWESHVTLQLAWSQVTQLGYLVKHRDGVSVPPPRVGLVVCVLRANKVLVVHDHLPCLLGEDKAVWSMRVRYLQLHQGSRQAGKQKRKVSRQ